MFRAWGFRGLGFRVGDKTTAGNYARKQRSVVVVVRV